MKESNVLVFTIATNGYDRVFEDHIESQQNYAIKNGYDFRLVNKAPEGGISGSDSAWLKVPLITKALKEGYEWVVFLDSDCMVLDHTPKIESIEKPGKYFYMAKDCRLDIPNTGVMIIKKDHSVNTAFKRILSLSDLPLKLLPKKHWALYEMGHVVHFTIQKDFFEILDQRWNDTINKYSDHYILHAHGSYSKKQRSKEKPLTMMQSLMYRLSLGPRYYRLKKLSDYYWNN